MSDFERLLRDSLKSVGEGYEGPDVYAARQEFLRRRRRRKVVLWAGGAVAAGAAAAIAAVAFLVLGESPESIRKVAPVVTPAISQREPELEPIPVGKGPNGISVGQDGYAWAIASGSDELVRIDPVDNSVDRIHLDVEEPEDVLAAAGAVWVTDPQRGQVIRYDPQTDESTTALDLAESPTFDLAAGDDGDVWALDSGGDLYRIDGDTGERSGQWTVGDDVVDVSAFGSEVWLYDQGAGEVVEWDPDIQEVVTRLPVGDSSSVDLVAGPRDVWFYRGSDGRLLQIDKESGEIVKRIKLEGSFAGLTIAGDRLWAMVTETGGQGTLFQIDLNTAEEIDEGIPVPDTPYDVAAGYGSVWVTNNDTGEVTRISFEESAPEIEQPRFVFYYSDGDDIWAYDSAFQRAQITDTPEPELSPTLSRDAQRLAFQRGEWDGSDQPRIVRLNLQTGRETILGRGVSPAYGSEGQLAFAVQDGETGLASRFGIVEPDESKTTFVTIPADLGSGVVERIAWDAFGRELFFQHAGETTQIFGMDVALANPAPVVPPDSAEGSVLISPSIEEPGVLTAIELCCETEPESRFERAELGDVVGSADGWRRFQPVVGIADLFDEVPGTSLFAEPAGLLDFEGDVGWTAGDSRAWFVGDGDELWLVHDSDPGIRDRVSLNDVDSIAVNPVFLNALEHESSTGATPLESP